VAAALCLTPLTDTAEALASKLDGRLDNGTAHELHGLVYVEHYRLSDKALVDCVRRALGQVYGPDWAEHVEGIE
jgi:hypothetical protein